MEGRIRWLLQSTPAFAMPQSDLAVSDIITQKWPRIHDSGRAECKKPPFHSPEKSALACPPSEHRAARRHPCRALQIQEQKTATPARRQTRCTWPCAVICRQRKPQSPEPPGIMPADAHVLRSLKYAQIFRKIPDMNNVALRNVAWKICRIIAMMILAVLIWLLAMCMLFVHHDVLVITGHRTC